MESVQAASDAVAVPDAPVPRVLEIRFTGSGSEYFRMWAVNLLLIMLSCGLYLPFAKNRRLRYLYANTWIDGQALAFHGDAWKMFRGFVLLAVLMVAYTLAGEFAPAAATPAFVLLCVVWPALWRASMQFRLGNTSWRGLRLGFEGPLAGAYLGFLPVFLPWALTVALVPAGSGPKDDPGVNGGLWFLATMALAGLMTPWSTALLKRYQHRGYRIAAEQAQIGLRTRSVYFLGFKTAVLGLLMSFLALLGTFAIGSLLTLVFTGKVGMDKGGAYYGLAAGALFYLFAGAVVMPYYAARVQNLSWGTTHSASLRFSSDLTGLTGLTLKNWLLIVATLGLYRPFAVIATTQMRLEAVRIEALTEPETWVAREEHRMTDASGDVAGDFFGVDVGL